VCRRFRICLAHGSTPLYVGVSYQKLPMQISKANPQESESAENLPPFPRLAVSDLLILTLAVGFSFACDAPEFHDGFRQYDVTWRVVPDLIDTFVRGILLFGLIVLARERIRGSTRPLSPGHWILLAIGPFAMWVLLAGVFRPILAANWNYEGRKLFAADETLCALLMGVSIVIVVPALRKLQTRWLVCLSLVLFSITLVAVWCVLEVAFFLGHLPNPIWRRHVLALGGTTQGMVLISVCIAVAIDAVQRVGPRDWLHLVGVLAVILNAVSCLLHWSHITMRWWRDLYFHLLP
jgi:hypothetical protein